MWTNIPRYICSARVNLEINGRSSKEVKAKLDSCGSVSIAYETCEAVQITTNKAPRNWRKN
jgi:hypothetical protein